MSSNYPTFPTHSSLSLISFPVFFKGNNTSSSLSFHPTSLWAQFFSNSLIQLPRKWYFLIASLYWAMLLSYLTILEEKEIISMRPNIAIKEGQRIELNSFRLRVNHYWGPRHIWYVAAHYFDLGLFDFSLSSYGFKVHQSKECNMKPFGRI